MIAPTKACALFLALLTCSPVFGRLNETESQLVERYGKVLMRGPESVIEQGKIYTLADDLHFRSDDWFIIARLVNGRCESISYSKPGDWTEEQFRYLLESNGTRAQWEERKTPTPKLHRQWLRRDSATAEWRMLQSLTIESRTYAKARADLKKRAKEESSKTPKF